MIKEAVIIVGGMGTRLLPYTKTVTKEMLPIFDNPNIFYLVKEAYLSGINKIIFVVTKRNKYLIKNFFQNDSYLNHFIANKTDKQKLLDDINEIITNVKFSYVFQKERGTYGALYSARKLIQNDDFLVMYGDDLIDSEIPLAKQLINDFQKEKKMIVALKKVDDTSLPNGGIAKLDKDNNMIALVKKNQDHDNAIVHGRFILNKKIFTVKDKLQHYDNHELYLPHALLNFQNEVKGFYYEGTYFNIGEKLGFIKASIHYASKNKLYADELRKFMTDYLKEN